MTIFFIHFNNLSILKENGYVPGTLLYFNLALVHISVTFAPADPIKNALMSDNRNKNHEKQFYNFKTGIIKRKRKIGYIIYKMLFQLLIYLLVIVICMIPTKMKHLIHKSTNNQQPEMKPLKFYNRGKNASSSLLPYNNTIVDVSK